MDQPMGSSVRHGPQPSDHADWVVTVASSAGGLNALLVLLPMLPATFGGAVVCVQHLSPDHPSHLVEILTRRCHLVPSFVEGSHVLGKGVLLLAPPDHHVVIERDHAIHLSDTPIINFVRPAADVLFESAAEAYGDKAIGVVLSGMGQDGADGVRAIRAYGGTVIVQDPATARFPSMPLAAVRAVTPDKVLPVEAIADELARLVPAVPAVA